MSYSFFAPINSSVVQNQIKDHLVTSLLRYRACSFLTPFEPVIARLAWDTYPIANAYIYLLGQPIPTNYVSFANRISPAERGTREGYHAIPFVFWSRIAATVQSWAPIPRYSDGVLEANEQLQAYCIESLISLPIKNSVETWLATVAEWLHCCCIDEILEHQTISSSIYLIREETQLTIQLAQQMLAQIEYSYLH